MREFKVIGEPRRVREDRRFVTGAARYVADIKLPGLVHTATVASPHPAAGIEAIDASNALAHPGVHAVVTGRELVDHIDPLMNGLDTPNVRRLPLAVDEVRYVGEWVVAVVADTRAIAEDAAELVRVDYAPRPHVIDAEVAYRSDSPAVHSLHGSNVLLDRTFTWGDVDADFAAAPQQLSFRTKWGRSSTVPLETFGVVASWDPWREWLEVWASIQMPKFADQLARALRLPGNGVRVHQDVDVGGSYGVKRGIKQSVLAGYLSKKLARPVRLVEDRLENMRAGDAHGPERLFDVDVAFDESGRVVSLKIRALDNIGAYAGRSPFQLGKPIGAIVGPYRIGSVRYQAIAVTTNKTPQEAVRGFGQSPTNYALEMAMDEVAYALGIDRIDVRRRNFIHADEFPYRIPSGSTYDSGDYATVVAKVLDHVDIDHLVEARDAIRSSGHLAGIGVAACLEPSGGNSSFEPLLNPANETTTWMESCRVNVDIAGNVTAAIHTTSSGQGHETLVATVVGEALGIDPDDVRVVRPDSLASLPSNSPVGSRMAIMLGGAAFQAAIEIREKLVAIGAHRLAREPNAVEYEAGTVRSGDEIVGWETLIEIAHRRFHELPPGMSPGLSGTHVLQVPTGERLPADDRVQMYPCYAFEFHVVLVAIDPVLGQPSIERYVVGHDCGVVINPHIVKGMTMGGVAHGIGAALFEEFAYDDEGQLLTMTFMDYPIPSSHEVPTIEIVEHCTPSPLTEFGQKGSGESGYLGAPAAISSAINNAVHELGITFRQLPMRMAAVSDAIAAARTRRSTGP